MMSRRWLALIALVGLLSCAEAWAAEMWVGDLKMRPNGSAGLTVSGSINGESTFGWTVMLELKPREGNRGSVTFTRAPAGHPDRRSSFTVYKRRGRLDTIKLEQVRREGVDIRQLGDAWSGAGSFTVYDTQRAGADTLNGAVDDNGTFVPSPVTFSGPVAFFPIEASPNARGVWDVALWTAAGNSGWEAVETQLGGGTIVISSEACETHRDCNDRDPCTDDTCKAGTCAHAKNDRVCREAQVPKRHGRRKRQ